MSAEAYPLSLLTTISGLQAQIEDLKQAKQDLRSDKASLKAEAEDLKDKLRAALAEVSRLKEELLNATSLAGELQKQCETLKSERELRDQARHQSISVQKNLLSEPTPAPVALIPQGSPLTPDPTPSPIVNLLSPFPSQNTSCGTTWQPPSQTRKRNVAALVGPGEPGEPPSKRMNTLTYHNTRSQHHVEGPSVVDPTITSTLKAGRTQDRPAIQFDEDVAFVLPPHILQHYLGFTPPLDISPPPSELHVSREFLADIYGGSPKQNAQHVGAFENPSGDCHRAFTFLRHDLNPDMPLVPGQGGVIVASRYDRKTGHAWGLFRKDITGKTQTWLYLGEYEWVAMGAMSADTFRRQRQEVKENWADELLDWRRGLGDYYPSMRARIALRKAGLLPAGDLSNHQKLVREELDRIKSQNGHPVGRKDIITAFERGEEALDITLLRCVSYDRTLALDIEEKFNSPPARKRRTTKTAYNYPSEFRSRSTRGHKSKPKGNRPNPPPPATNPEAPGPYENTDPEPRLRSPNCAPGNGATAEDDPILHQEIGGACNVEESTDDGLSYVSQNDLDELSYP